MSRIIASIGNFREDVRFAARQFRRAPRMPSSPCWFWPPASAQPTAMFIISYGVLLKPLPFRADRQLFEVVENTSKGDEGFAATRRPYLLKRALPVFSRRETCEQAA